MAIIGKIREKSWLLLIVIGGALVTFIFTSQGPNAGGGAEEVYGIGTVYGEKVDQKAFQKDVDEAQASAQKQREGQELQQAQQEGRKPRAVNAEPVNQDQIWSIFAQDLVFEKEYEALGIEVSPAELDAYLYGTNGFDVLPNIAKSFSDSTGKFNPDLLKKQVEELSKPSKVKGEPTEWDRVKESLISQRRRQKYMDVLEQGIYVTSLEAKDEYFARETKKNITYAVKRYAEIKDSKIKVTNAKLRKYFNKNKGNKKYENKFSVHEVRFTDITIVPSKEDSAKFNAEMDVHRKALTASATAQSDSMYVVQNSDLKFYSSTPISTAVPDGHPEAKGLLNFPRQMESEFENAQVGDVVGPYLSQGTYNLAKVIGFTSDTLNARHILIPVEAGKEAEAEARADSIMEVINHDNFVEYVEKYSTDTGSKAKEGDLGDFFFTKMVQPFGFFCADKPVGEIGKVTSQFGIHIIEVTDKRGPKRPRLTIIQNALESSQKTMDDAESAAYSLLDKMYAKIEKNKNPYRKVVLFDTLAARAGGFSRTLTIEDNNPKLNEFNSPYAENEIYKLAYNPDAKVGDLIGSPVKDGNRRIIAIVSAIKVKGESNYYDVKAAVKSDYIQDVKAKRLMSRMRGKSVKELANDRGTRSNTAEITFASSNIENNYEPEIVGSLYTGLKDGKMTQPLKGNSGVYVITVNKTTKAKANTNYDIDKKSMVAAKRARLSNDVTKALLDKADVVDNRKFYDIGVRR